MVPIRRTSVGASRTGSPHFGILKGALALSLLLLTWCGEDALAQSSSARTRVVFFVADDGQHGRELWISDGTGWGTGLVRDIRAGPESSAISELTSAGNRVFFTAVNKDGRELWVSDGTRSGTKRVRDIFRGPIGSEPSLLTPYGSDILFVADGGRGKSIWVSDGTPSGTKPLLSRNRNKRIDDVQDLLAIGRRVYIVDKSEIVVFDARIAGSLASPVLILCR